jgi:Trk-type K+ transport system membrane component
MGVSLWYQDEGLSAFIIAFFVMSGIGVLCWFPARHKKKELHLHDGFMITAVFWTVLSVVGALPFLLIPNYEMTLAQAVFEAVSGFTTTGATVINQLGSLPKSILYYRQQLQWLGGLGIIVLAVAVLPMLGIGGMQLYKAETPGPMRDEKLTPRIGQTAKALLYIYISLTLACAIAYWIAGMTLFDAIGHSFSTVATGGFSTHDASLGYYNSPVIEIIAMIFIILGSLNFTVHFVVWHKYLFPINHRDTRNRVFSKNSVSERRIKSLKISAERFKRVFSKNSVYEQRIKSLKIYASRLKRVFSKNSVSELLKSLKIYASQLKKGLHHYWQDIQGRVFINIVLVLIAITVIVLMWQGVYTHFWTALRHGSFAVISIISSTGYITADFSVWPLFLPVLILGSGFIGGCVGSTAGGFRVIRLILLYKQAIREIMRLIHPNAVIAVKIGQKKVPDNVAQAVGGFALLYMASYVFLSLLFLATGVDYLTAFSGVAATLNMTGPALGNIAVTYGDISDTGLWILSFAMLLARLEIFTLLVLLTPAFWRR